MKHLLLLLLCLPVQAAKVRDARELAIERVGKLKWKLKKKYGINLKSQFYVGGTRFGVAGMAAGSVPCDEDKTVYLSEETVINGDDKKVMILLLHEEGHIRGLAHDTSRNRKLALDIEAIRFFNTKGEREPAPHCPTSLMYPSIVKPGCIETHWEYYIKDIKYRFRLMELGLPFVPYFKKGCHRIKYHVNEFVVELEDAVKCKNHDH